MVRWTWKKYYIYSIYCYTDIVILKGDYKIGYDKFDGLNEAEYMEVLENGE